MVSKMLESTLILFMIINWGRDGTRAKKKKESSTFGDPFFCLVPKSEIVWKQYIPRLYQSLNSS